MKQMILAAILTAFAIPASAKCAIYDEYRGAIEQEGGERLFIQGESPVYASNGTTRVEVYINPETQSLSYMFVRPDGNGGELMCLGDFLPKFDFVSPVEEEEGDPT